MKWPIGSIGWVDLTVPNADKVRDFYATVTGWTTQDLSMGGYEDYLMVAESGTPTAGVCWRQGENAHLPPVWLMYIIVADLDASLAAVRANGGKVLSEAKNMGEHGRYAIIEDPAGAACALHQNPPES